MADEPLAKEIVIVNEFSIPEKSRGKTFGSRGSTPGEYVLRYMARDRASETLAPIKLDALDDFVVHYMARAGASEALGYQDSLPRTLMDVSDRGGLSFGHIDEFTEPSVSFSESELKSVSSYIQSGFEGGHTALKTVISFDEEYLRQMGCLDETFIHTHRGDWLGHIDQAKMRSAINAGVASMCDNMDAPVWCGVIQGDTDHLHCHLVIMDMGRGRLSKDGTQKGKLSVYMRRKFRSAFDERVRSLLPMKCVSQEYTREVENVKSYVRQSAYKDLASAAEMQTLVAELPDDDALWHAESKHVRMRRPNRIAYQMIDRFLDSHVGCVVLLWQDVHRRLKAMIADAKERTRRYIQYRKRMVFECMNALYDAVRDAVLPKRLMQDAEKSAVTGAAKGVFGACIVRFQFVRKRLSEVYRNYREAHRIREAGIDDVDQKVSGGYGQYIAATETYNRALVDKYQYEAQIAPDYTEVDRTFKQFVELSDDLFNLCGFEEYLREHPMSSSAAEEFGRSHFGLSGAGVAISDPATFTSRLARMRHLMDTKLEKLEDACVRCGCHVVESNGTYELIHRPQSEYKDVCALDAHIDSGREYPKMSLEAAQRCALWRRRALDAVESDIQIEPEVRADVEDAYDILVKGQAASAQKERDIPQEVNETSVALDSAREFDFDAYMEDFVEDVRTQIQNSPEGE